MCGRGGLEGWKKVGFKNDIQKVGQQAEFVPWLCPKRDGNIILQVTK